MARSTPLRRHHEQAEASLTTYGPAGTGGERVELVETFGEFEAEYAAIRKHCALFDQPNRGVIELTGADRLAFLQRMVTQDLRRLQPFRVRRAFWLNRKGRIDADLRIIDLPDRTLLDLDVHAVPRTLEGLASHVVGDDTTISDATGRTHRLALHGPTSAALLGELAQSTAGSDASGPPFSVLEAGQACVVRLAGHDVIVDRDDSTGSPGYEMIVHLRSTESVYTHLLEEGADHAAPGAVPLTTSASPGFPKRPHLRAAGWHAYNVARIESGRPLYNIDFGPDSVPAETGVFEDRVSLSKGCYLGQEIVARMHALGHPKQRLVALRIERVATPDGEPLQPVTGAFVSREAEPGTAVGAVTSSCVSPMLGSAPVAFAMVRFEAANAGDPVLVEAAGEKIRAVIQPSLRFWPAQREAARRT